MHKALLYRGDCSQCQLGSVDVAAPAVLQRQSSPSASSEAQARHPAGLGKPLPSLPSKAATTSSKQAQGIEQICKELTTLMQADDECRVYMRESKGLASLASMLSQVHKRRCSCIEHCCKPAHMSVAVLLLHICCKCIGEHVTC